MQVRGIGGARPGFSPCLALTTPSPISLPVLISFSSVFIGVHRWLVILFLPAIKHPEQAARGVGPGELEQGLHALSPLGLSRMTCVRVVVKGH